MLIQRMCACGRLCAASSTLLFLSPTPLALGTDGWLNGKVMLRKVSRSTRFGPHWLLPLPLTFAFPYCVDVGGGDTIMYS